MAKGTTDFARQSTEQAVQATDWMRAIAEQNLNQSKAACEGLLTIARNAVSGVDQQAAFIRDSMLFAEETLENTFDFAHKLVRMRAAGTVSDPDRVRQTAGPGAGRLGGKDHAGSK